MSMLNQNTVDVRIVEGNRLITIGGYYKEFIGIGAISNGTVTFNLTLDGSPTGVSFFTEVWSSEAICFNNTSAIGGVSLVGGKLLAADLKTVSFNAVDSRVVILAAEALEASPNGTQIRCTIKGI